MNGNGINAYRQSNVITAEPKRLVILCYETMISNLKMAKECYITKDYETKAKCLQKVQDIICELMNALDFEKGGEVARNLSSLYNFLSRHILNADLKRDIKALTETIEMMAELKSAWQEIFYGLPKAAPVEPTAFYNTIREKTAVLYGA